MKIKILIPIYNDWRSVFDLLNKINNEISDLSEEISVMIVNDGSNEEKEEVCEPVKTLEQLQEEQTQQKEKMEATLALINSSNKKIPPATTPENIETEKSNKNERCEKRKVPK